MKDSLKQKRFKLSLSTFNAKLLTSVLVVNVVIAAIAIYFKSYYFNIEYLKANIVNLIIITVISVSTLYLTYPRITKKRPHSLLLIVYLLLVVCMIFNVVGLTYLIERLFNRGSFSNSNTLFINTVLLLALIMVSRYDFPVVDNAKNLGVFVVMMAIVSFIGLQNRTFIYSLALLPIIALVYLSKAVLASMRK
jgi:CDP-diglyceride synthetase